jgi:hypothetical protein
LALTGSPSLFLSLHTGGTPDSQREFLDSLSTGDQRRTIDRQRVPPVANNFALGYTYYDVLDADQEGLLSFPPEGKPKGVNGPVS